MSVDRAVRTLVILALLALAADARAETLSGTIRLKDQTPAAGATIVAMALDGARGEAVAITDENGRFELTVERGTYQVVVYYAESTTSLAERLEVTTDALFLDAFVEAPKEIGCVFEEGRYLGNTGPLFGKTTDRGWPPVARDRTHRAWIAPVVGADPATAVTTLDRGARLPGAPGVPLAFVQDVGVYTYRVPIGLAAGPGGAADVTLRSGSNEGHGDARAVLGLARGDASAGVEALAGGPLVEDRAWLAGGLVATSARDFDAMVHGNYAPSWAHNLSVAALGTAHDDDTRDGWAGATWISKLDDAKLELRALATAERLELPTPVAARSSALPGALVADRAGGELGLTRRGKLGGYHALEVDARGGVGSLGDERATDATLAAGDAWQPRPDIQIEVGVRGEHRTLGDARATVIAPRALVSWDWTREGRSDLFVGYQRVPHLDAADWRTTDPRSHDEVDAGVAFHRSSNEPIMVGALVRVRGTDELGVEGWVHYQSRRTAVRLAATSLGRVGSAVAQHAVLDHGANKLIAAITVLATPSTADGGAAVTWRHRVGKQASTDLAVEAFEGSAGPAARLLLGVTF